MRMCMCIGTFLLCERSVTQTGGAQARAVDDGARRGNVGAAGKKSPGSAVHNAFVCSSDVASPDVLASLPALQETCDLRKG